MRGSGGIAVPAVRTPEGPDEEARVDERVQPLRLLERDHLGLHAEIAGAGADELQTVELSGCRCEHETAVRVQPTRLARQRLDLAVEVDRILLQLGDVRLAIERVHAAGCMPRRAGRELALLEEQNVLPADPGEVVKHAGADHPTPDDDGSRGTLHAPMITLDSQRTSGQRVFP